MFYITTSLPYTNAKPHIGFAMELIEADVLARFYRARGKEVFFLTGTDEHGMKMAQTAKETGVPVKELVDRNSQTFQDLCKALNITNSDFIRTTSDRHKRGAIKLWKALEQAGDIYPSVYKGFYCVGCEAYITEKDLVDEKCSIHQKNPTYLEEKNYFFRYSKYVEDIAQVIESDQLRIIPLARKHEMLNLLEKSAKEKKDISFSRPRTALDWGISVPSDPSQTMYVWPDALSNYITAVDYEQEGELFQKFWPAEVQLIGKDILRFHAGLWIAMLLSAKLQLPKAIYVHGFITSEGMKMSKSIGNVVDPFAVVEDWGIDPLRYYLIREISTTEDGDFSKTRLQEIYNKELANNLGNLVSRVLTMNEKFGKSVRFANRRRSRRRIAKAGLSPVSREAQKLLDEVKSAYGALFKNFNLKAAVEEILKLVEFANEYVDRKKPWELQKKNPEELYQVLSTLMTLVREIGELFSPVMPATSEKIIAQVKHGKKAEALFPRKE